MDTSPPLLGNDDLPGPMCLNLLASSGALCKLDSANAYSSHDSDTLYGRACIIATLLPSRSVACARTAAWVWLGGTFPDSIDIIAKAHYRTLRYGRKINVFNRVAPSEHTIKVGPITVTTPVRTACDLALNCVPETESKVSEIICMLMQEFHFRSNDCMQIMEDAKHIRNAPQARNYILAIDGKGYEHGNRKDCEDRKNRKDAEYVRGARQAQSTAIPAQATTETTDRAAISPDSVDAAGGMQSRHCAGRALAYRGIRASTAQMADC